MSDKNIMDFEVPNPGAREQIKEYLIGRIIELQNELRKLREDLEHKQMDLNFTELRLNELIREIDDQQTRLTRLNQPGDAPFNSPIAHDGITSSGKEGTHAS